jgi:hypothetical protein
MAYLLRLWQVKGKKGLVWRASLESARAGERRGFASLGELVDFLRERTEKGEGMGDEITGREKRRAPDSDIQ